MTNEEAIKWLKDIHCRFNPTGEKLENEGGDVHLQALDMAIEALKQVTGKLKNPDDSLLTEDAEACKEQKSKLDLISRQDAINAIENTDVKITAGEWDELTNAIESLPSTEPKTGEWVEKKWAEESYGLLISNYECSNCMAWVKEPSDFCPNCGADMRKGADDE